MEYGKHPRVLRGLRRVALLVGAALCLALAACGTVTAAQGSATMRVSVDIKDYGQGTTQVAIHFADAAGNTVEFVHGETVTCNGVFLKYDSGFYARLFGYGAYTGETPLQPANGAYTFVYTPPGGKAVTVAVPVVAAYVTVTQPAIGAAVSLPIASAPFTVAYAVSGLAHTSIYGAVNDSRAHLAIAFTLNEPGTLTFKTDDFKDFQPGPATLTVARVTSSNPASGFHSTSVNYENITTVQFLWV